MNMRSLTVVFGALTALALGACKVESTGGTGGTGGGSTTTGDTTTVGSGGGATGTGGAAACDPKYRCADAIDPMDGDPTKLCEGPAAVLYDAFAACSCTGACKAACGDNACAMPSTPASAACTMCLQDIVAGCGKEFNDCANAI